MLSTLDVNRCFERILFNAVCYKENEYTMHKHLDNTHFYKCKKKVKFSKGELSNHSFFFTSQPADEYFKLYDNCLLVFLYPKNDGKSEVFFDVPYCDDFFTTERSCMVTIQKAFRKAIEDLNESECDDESSS